MKKINMYDLYKLLPSVHLRNIFRSSSSVEELEKRLILNCIDELEKNMNTNLFYELLGEFFEPKGYHEDLIKEQNVFQVTMQYFYDQLLEFEEFDDELISEIQHMIEEKTDFSTIKDFLSQWIKSYSELEELFESTENTLDFINDKFIKAFKDHIFKGTVGYQNAKEYLDVVQEYVNEYVDEEDISYEFDQCIQRVLNTFSLNLRYGL